MQQKRRVLKTEEIHLPGSRREAGSLAETQRAARLRLCPSTVRAQRPSASAGG
jgi:hypothetical protein